MAPRKDPWPDTDKLITYAFPVLIEHWPAEHSDPKTTEFLGVHLYVVDPEDTYRIGKNTTFTRGWWMLVGVPTGNDSQHRTPGSHFVAIRRKRFMTQIVPSYKNEMSDIASNLPDSKGGTHGHFEYMPWRHELVATTPSTLRQVDLDLLGEIFLPIAFKAYNAAVAWFDRGRFERDMLGRGIDIPVIRP